MSHHPLKSKTLFYTTASKMGHHLSELFCLEEWWNIPCLELSKGYDLFVWLCSSWNNRILKENWYRVAPSALWYAEFPLKKPFVAQYQFIQRFYTKDDIFIFSPLFLSQKRAWGNMSMGNFGQLWCEAWMGITGWLPYFHCGNGNLPLCWDNLESSSYPHFFV